MLPSDKLCGLENHAVSRVRRRTLVRQRPTANNELVEMAVRPSQRSLQHSMKLCRIQVQWQQETSPVPRLNVADGHIRLDRGPIIAQ